MMMGKKEREISGFVIPIFAISLWMFPEGFFVRFVAKSRILYHDFYVIINVIIKRKTLQSFTNCDMKNSGK
jgi:hypothetical protein